MLTYSSLSSELDRLGPNDIAPHLKLADYCLYGVVAITFFALMHFSLDMILRHTYPKYVQMDKPEQNEYSLQYIRIVHGAIAAAGSAYSIWWSCPDGATFFTSEECRLVPRNSHVWVCFFTAGFLCYDSYGLMFLTTDRSTVVKQRLLHHVAGLLNYYIAFWQQDFTVTIGAAFIFIEISSPFVGMRSVLFHHGFKGTILQAINTGLLFITFVFVRTIF